MTGIEVIFSPSQHDEDSSLLESEEENDVVRVSLANAPYQDEPLALGPQGKNDLPGEEGNEDGVSLDIIEAQYNKVEPVAQ